MTHPPESQPKTDLKAPDLFWIRFGCMAVLVVINIMLALALKQVKADRDAWKRQAYNCLGVLTNSVRIGRDLEGQRDYYMTNR